MGVLITWKELTGIPPSKAQVQEQLAPYSLQAILLGLARLSAQLVTWQQKQNSKGELEAVRQMLPRYYPTIAGLVSASSDRVILTRITLLYVAKQALSVCPLNGRDVETASDDERIMTCCLMANDLLLGRMPRPDDRAIDKAASLLPFSNYLPDFDDPLDIPRNLILMDEIAPRLTDIIEPIIVIWRRNSRTPLASLLEPSVNSSSAPALSSSPCRAKQPSRARADAGILSAHATPGRP